jgi:hypothetical protein
MFGENFKNKLCLNNTPQLTTKPENSNVIISENSSWEIQQGSNFHLHIHHHEILKSHNMRNLSNMTNHTQLWILRTVQKIKVFWTPTDAQNYCLCLWISWQHQNLYYIYLFKCSDILIMNLNCFPSRDVNFTNFL